MRFALIRDMSPGVDVRECWLDLDQVVAIRPAVRQSGVYNAPPIDISILEIGSGRTYAVDMHVSDALRMVEGKQ